MISTGSAKKNRMYNNIIYKKNSTMVYFVYFIYIFSYLDMLIINILIMIGIQ